MISSEELLRLYPQPMEGVAAPSTPDDVAPPMTPGDENVQNTRRREPTEHRGREPAEHQGREPAEHQGREPAEHQGREPAEHQGREPAEHQGHEPDGDEPAMLPQGLEQEELEAYAANNAAEQLQGLDRRDPVPRAQPEGPPSAEEVAAHNLTHVPFQRWCESCVATRAEPGANRETKVPVVQIDFYFTSLDDHARPAGQGEQDTCCLIGVDLETKMVLSPTKEQLFCTGRLRRSPASRPPWRRGCDSPVRRGARHQGCRPSRGRSHDQAWKENLAANYARGGHSNGGAERAVQTVRRLGTCLFHALELKAGTFGLSRRTRL